MCGVFGFIGKPRKSTSIVMRNLAYWNMERGTDSSGIAFISPDQQVIYKKAVNAYELFNRYQLQKLLYMFRQKPFTILLGHTRMATRGAVTSNNAHPFKIGNTIMTHNGVISNFDMLQREWDTEYQVDSQIIGHLLDRKGLDKTVSELTGMYTVPFVTQHENDTLQVIVHRNPFCFAYKDDQLYYSSSMKHLQSSLEGHEGFTFVTAKDDNIYRFYRVAWSNEITFTKQKIVPKIPYYNNTGPEWWKKYGLTTQDLYGSLDD